ncbi:MAG: hypothetical protein IPL40_13890 [Proteobacteria bacterium]|nr:hypothetical protein [Pseudomonadota bacterium]
MNSRFGRRGVERLLRASAVLLAAVAISACGAVGAIDEQLPGGGDEALAQRALTAGLQASPSGDRVMFRTEALDGARLVAWAKLQTDDIVAFGWIGRVFRYQHAGVAELLQSRADQAELVVAGSVAAGAQIGLPHFQQGETIAPQVLIIHGLDPATHKVRYSITACANDACDAPIAPTILEAALDTPIDLEGRYRLGFQANAAAPNGAGVIFGLSRTDGRIQGCGSETLEQCRAPSAAASPVPVASPVPAAAAPVESTPAASPAPAAQPASTEPTAVSPAAAPAPQAPASKDDDDDGISKWLPWIAGAAVVGLGVYGYIVSQPAQAPVENRVEKCSSDCASRYAARALEQCYAGCGYYPMP